MKHTILFIFLSLLFGACAGSKQTKPVPKKPKVTTTTKPPVTPPVTAPPRPELGIETGVTDIQWVDSDRLMPVLEEAQRLGKPVFVAFHATWCAPCKVMESEIFTQRPVYEYLNAHFINFHTDYDSDSGKTIASIYEVSKLPTVLFVNPQGVVIQRYTGIISPDLVQQLGDLTLNSMK